MPFKFQIIKNLQKYLASNSKQSSEEQNELTSSLPQQKDKCRYDSKLRLRTGNMYQVSLQRCPLNERHIANFFNIIAINQEAIRSQDGQESYFRTLFYTKKVRRVVSKRHYLVLNLHDSDFYFPPIQYTIQRFKSFGDQRYFRLAILLQKATNKLKQLQDYDGKNQRKMNSELVEGYIESLGNMMFCCKSDNKWFISKSLLQLLEYDPESLSIELVKYRASFHEACSTQNYFEVMVNNFQNLCKLVDLLLDHISLQTFLDNSIIRFKDSLYTRHNKKINCKIKVGMPTPLVTIFEIQEVINISEEFQSTPYFQGLKKRHLSQGRQRLRESQLLSLKHITMIPPNYYPQNKPKVAGYIQRDSGEYAVKEECTLL